MSWNVIRRGRVIETVWFAADCDADYVRRALINHDGFPSDITVRRV